MAASMHASARCGGVARLRAPRASCAAPVASAPHAALLRRSAASLRCSPHAARDAHVGRSRRGPRAPSAAATDEVPAEWQSAWQECTAQVCALGFTADEAELMVRKALAWGFKGYWRTEKVRAEPVPEAQAARLAYLRDELQLSDDALRKVLTAFPEALGLDVKQRMLPNVAFLARSYRLEGPTLAGVLERKPQVLGNTVDCAGDCVGECNRCWARF